MSGEKASSNRLISVEEISTHQSPNDLWLVVDDTVYDLSDFASHHPGGAGVLVQHAGHDATTAYAEVHAPSLIRVSLPASCTMGKLDKSTLTKEWATSGRRPPQSQSPPLTHPPAATVGSRTGHHEPSANEKLNGPPPPPPPPASTNTTNSNAAPTAAKPALTSLLNAHDFRRAAQQTLTPKAWAFASSAATDCLTAARNGTAYDEIALRPRVLRDVEGGRVDLTTKMLGRRIAAPLFVAPTSMGRLFHAEGERELGRAAQSLGIPQCVSTSCSFPLAEVMDAVEEEDEKEGRRGRGTEGAGTTVPVFFQLYVDKDRRKSEALLKLVRERGVKAVFLTVDAPVIGKREADERLKADESIRLPMSGMKAQNDTKGGSLGRIMGHFIDASLTWDDISWLRRAAPGLPVVLKGIQTAMDAVKAMEAGVDAIYISNHGGRSLDTAPATILILLELQKCCPQIFDKMEVYIDGGITRGTDIFKALCLGARAVGIGRGFLFALNYGKEGIEHFVNILVDELQTTMQQCGITSLDQVHPGLLHTGAVDHLVPGSEQHPYAKWSPRSKL